MNTYIVAFLVGIVWQLVLGFNTRVVAKGDRMHIIIASQITLSLLWGLLIRTVMLSPEVIWFYAIGTGIGVFIGVKLTQLLYHH